MRISRNDNYETEGPKKSGELMGEVALSIIRLFTIIRDS